jgi:Zn-dependent peptidase ImmA (M78 family)/transcriptional regulator with XRE-family HTH domain
VNVDLVAVGARVRAARTRAGLSQRDVVSRSGMSQSTLHRLETGTRISATLTEFDQLAQALSVGVDELLYGSPVENRVLAAARVGSGTSGDVRSALDQAIELLKLDDRLDAAVPALRQKQTHPSLDVPASGGPRVRGKVLAEQVRATLGLEVAPIADLVEAVEQLTGVDVGSMPLPSGVSGICATDPLRETSIVLVNSSDVAERQRFTLAHELGHLLSGDATHVDAVDGRRSAGEMLCDEFARHVLIPQAGVQAWLIRAVGAADKARVDERAMALLARHFGVSPEPLRIQLDGMRLLPSQLKEMTLPTGKVWAYRYGWGPQFDSDQAAASQPRVPRRVLDRAIEAYRAGQLGVAALARLQDRPVVEVERALVDAGVVAEPTIRRADVDALVARAASRGTLTRRPAS